MAAVDDRVRELQAAATGLLYPSEADKPVKVVSWVGDVSGRGPITAEMVRGLCQLNAQAPAHELTLDELFTPVTALWDWYGAAEKQRAHQFQELESLVRRLNDARVFRFGDTTADLVAVGRSSDGSLVGVCTQVVET